jgi:hypothetical protein
MTSLMVLGLPSEQTSPTKMQDPSSTKAEGSKLQAKELVQPPLGMVPEHTQLALMISFSEIELPSSHGSPTRIQDPSSVLALGLKLQAEALVHPFTGLKQAEHDP